MYSNLKPEWETVRKGERKRRKRKKNREVLFISQRHFYSIILGKQATTRSPLQFHSPATSLNCEIYKPRVQSRGAGRGRRGREHGWEINYLVEATRFIWLRKGCTGSRRCAGVHHKQHRLDWERNTRTNRFHKHWLIQLTSVKSDLIQESQKRRWLGGEEFRGGRRVKLLITSRMSLP